MHFEALEHRTLLTATLAAGVLTIAGTPGDDRITLSRTKDGKLVVTEKNIVKKPNGAGSIETADKTNFKLAEVTRLVVRTLDGRDTISLAGSKVRPLAIPADVDAGAGTDFVTGGSANDTLAGGDGDDRLTGGAGDDRLFGGAGKDRLYGDAGADLLDGGFGNDRFYSDDGAGTDTLVGGGTPAWESGATNDYAVIDAGDVVQKEVGTNKPSIKRVKTRGA